MLESKPGDQFDAERVERDARRLAAGGDDTRADYPLQRGQSGAALVLAVCCATAWVVFINCRATRPTVDRQPGAAAAPGRLPALEPDPSLTRGFFVGGTLAAGNAWVRRSAVSLAGLRTGISLSLGADTGSGPLYLGITHAPRGRSGLALFIGRP